MPFVPAFQYKNCPNFVNHGEELIQILIRSQSWTMPVIMCHRQEGRPVSSQPHSHGNTTPDRRHGKRRPIRVLVVDDEEAVLSETRSLLETFGMIVFTATSTAEALGYVSSKAIDVALIDWLLQGDADGIALGRSLKRDKAIPFVLFSGHLNTDVTGNAYKLGAADVVNKPLRPGRLLAAIELASESRPGRGGAHNPHTALDLPSGSESVSRRWAKLALRVCHRAKDDPKTEPAIAAAASVSTSVFRKLCWACKVSPSAARDLFRLLRAECLAREDGSTLRSHLASSDQTCRKLFQLAGLPMDSKFVPLRLFFLNQRIISPTKECLGALAHLAANDPLFFVEPDEDETGTD